MSTYINILYDRWGEENEQSLIVGKSGDEWDARAEIEDCLDSDERWSHPLKLQYLHTLVLDDDGECIDQIDLVAEVKSARATRRAEIEAERQCYERNQDSLYATIAKMRRAGLTTGAGLDDDGMGRLETAEERFKFGLAVTP